jgi:hypothetical protein
MPSIKRKTIPWKHREHLFTPSNITKFEFACSCDKKCPRKISIHIKVKYQRRGKVVWIMKGGQLIK